MSLRWTEDQLTEYQQRTAPTLEECGKKHGLSKYGNKKIRTDEEEPQKGKWQGGNLRLVLPFKLPTWNQLLAMDQWQRAKVRTWLKEQVSMCIQNGADLPTQTGLVRRLSLTPLLLKEYLKMITPNSSRKSRLRKKNAKQKKP